MSANDSADPRRELGMEVPDVLRRIVAQRRRRLASEGGGKAVPVDGEIPLCTIEDNDFLAALSNHRGRAVIAEIKMGSPKLGDLRGRFDPEVRASTYASAGAAALSVVVEPDFFHGSYELLSRCRAASGLPAIAKDFVVDDVQIRRAKEAGASAILLIAAILDREELVERARQARALGLVPLIETHGEGDFAKLVGESWELVGINNRDLRTFEVDLHRSARLIGSLPAAAFKVAESGIHEGADVALLRAAGFDGFLVGESLVLAEDPAAHLGELLG